MKMNDYNAQIANDVLAAITGLEAGTLTLGDTQAALQSAMALFENDGSGVANAVRLAEADLEAIQFKTLRDEQRSAAISRLDELRTAIEGSTAE